MNDLHRQDLIEFRYLAMAPPRSGVLKSLLAAPAASMPPASPATPLRIRTPAAHSQPMQAGGLWRLYDDPEPSWLDVRGDVAIIRIDGLIRPRRRWWSSTPGMDELVEVLGELKADRGVARIVQHVTSDGGVPNGLEDVAEAIRETAAVKPVSTFFSDAGCSAAYWFPAHSTEIVCDPLAAVGSLGVYVVLLDSSGLAAELGLRTVVVSSGGVKGLGARDDVPPELVDDVQREVDEITAIFRASVADGRGFSSAQLDALFDGRAHTGANALDLGLVDRVSTYRAFLASLGTEPEEPQPMEAIMPDTPDTNEQAPEAAAEISVLGRFLRALRAEEAQTPPADPPAAAASPPPAEPDPLPSDMRRALAAAARAEVTQAVTQALPKRLPPAVAREDLAGALAVLQLRELERRPDASFPSTATALGRGLRATEILPTAPAEALAVVNRAFGAFAQVANLDGLLEPNVADRPDVVVPQGRAQAEGAGGSYPEWADLPPSERTFYENNGYDEKSWQAFRSSQIDEVPS